MVETDKTAEVRRKAQRNGEEDPIIVAQRFLNIFRQLHIFSDEKRTAFNQMLLELSPDIRGMFRSIPGGGLLQEYVDDLAEGAGVEKSRDSSVMLPDEEVTKAKILAQALAEAQVQNTAQTPVDKSGKAIPVQTVIQGSGKVEMSEAFAREFARVMSEALKDNNNEQKEQIKLMLQGLGRTQLELIKILQNDHEKHNAETLSLSKMLTQAQVQLAELIKEIRNSPTVGASGNISFPETLTIAPAPETEKMIAMLAESQNEIKALVDKVSELQATGGASVISDKITVETSPEMLKMFEMLAQSQQQVTEMAEQIKSAAPTTSIVPDKIQLESSPEMLKMVEMLSESQKNITELLEKFNSHPLPQADKVISEPSAEMMQMMKMLSDSQQQISEMVERIKDAPTMVTTTANGETVVAAAPAANNPQLNKMLKMMSDSQEKIVETLAKLDFSRGSSQDNQDLCQLFENSQNQLTQIVTTINENHKSDTQVIAQAITDSQQQIAKLLNGTPRSDKGAKNNNSAEEYSRQINQIADKLADVQHLNVNAMEKVIEDIVSAQSQLYRNVAETQTKELSSIISLALQESQQVLAQNLIKVFGEMPRYYHPVASQTTAEPTQTSAVASFEQVQTRETSTEPETLTESNSDSSEPQKKKKKKKKKRKSEDDFNQAETLTLNAPATGQLLNEISFDELPGEDFDESNPQLWQETPEDNPANSWGFASADEELEEDAPEADERQQFTWQTPEEFETSPFDEPSSDIAEQSAEENADSAESSGEEGQDWEWDYEEIPEEASDGEEGQDWEWDYEEVPDSSEDAGSEQNLTFQENLYAEAENYDFLTSDFDVSIKDSRAKEQNEDPYQNSAL